MDSKPTSATSARILTRFVSLGALGCWEAKEKGLDDLAESEMGQREKLEILLARREAMVVVQMVEQRGIKVNLDSLDGMLLGFLFNFNLIQFFNHNYFTNLTTLTKSYG